MTNNPGEIEKRDLLNRLQKALSDALLLLVEEQEHHALSYRSISMVDNYAQIFPAFWRPHTQNLDDETKHGLARWTQWIILTLESALKEHARDYERVKRRTTIVLADLLEGAVESVLASCLRHLATDKVSLRDLTGSRGNISSERDLRFAVRSWEKRVYLEGLSRVIRFEKMLSTFFPEFVLPDNAACLNELFRLRNEFTHELIVVTDSLAPRTPLKCPTHQEIDDFFHSAGDFILAMMKAVPADVKGPLAVFDDRFSPRDDDPALDAAFEHRQKRS